MPDNIRVMVVGSGYMGKEHSKVLISKGYKPLIIGRGVEKANKLEKELGVPVVTGGIDSVLEKLDLIPENAIVAVNVDVLAPITEKLINRGVQRILVEKPAGLDRREIQRISELAAEKNAEVYVAYNRRFYASTEKALEIIQADGGVSSFHFEFTEWSPLIEKTLHSALTKQSWMLANSTHVIDLAFFLGGFPKEVSSFIGGSLTWHPRCSCYVGAGVSQSGALFSYCANWDAPGRWAVEILTKEHRLYFKPMEQLAIQNINSIQVSPVEINDAVDKEFKPGLYKQIDAFLEGKNEHRLVTISNQLAHMDYYEKIACKK